MESSGKTIMRTDQLRAALEVGERSGISARTVKDIRKAARETVEGGKRAGRLISI